MGIGSEFIELFKIGGTATVDTAPMLRNLSEGEKAAKSFASKLTSIGTKMSVAFTVPLTAMAVKSLAAIEEHNRAVAQTAAVLKSTGGAANVTQASLDSLTKSLGKQLAVDDDLVRQGANLLLTFQNIRNEVGLGNDVFDQAVRVMMDFAAATGTDATSAASTLGKALNSPQRGIQLLTRAGVLFTDAQKKQVEALIKTGDTMGAQKLILEQLTAMYGGSAAAQITASQRIATAFDTLAESIGTELLPYYERFAGIGETVVGIFEQLPGPVKGFAVALGGVVAMTGPFLAALGTIASGFIAVAAQMGVAALPLLGFIALATAVAAAAAYLGWALASKLAYAMYGTTEAVNTELNPAIVALGKSAISTSKKVKAMADVIRKSASPGVSPWVMAFSQMEAAFKDGSVTAEEAAFVLGEFMPQHLKDLGYSAESIVASWGRSMEKMQGSLVNVKGEFIKFAGLTKQKLKEWASSVSGNLAGVSDVLGALTGDKLSIGSVKQALTDQLNKYKEFQRNVRKVTDRLFDSGMSGGLAERTVRSLMELPNPEEIFATLSSASLADLREVANKIRDISNVQADLPGQAARYADGLHDAYLWAKRLSEIRLPLTTATMVTRSFKVSRESVFGAAGGIVTRPTLATIGESGPEAVVPLSRTPGSLPLPMMGGGNLSVSVLLDRKVFTRQQEYLVRASGF